MRQIGGCKLGEPLEGGRAALRAIAKYCSDGLPGVRAREFARDWLEDVDQLLSVATSVQGDARIPDESEGELVSPRAHRPVVPVKLPP